MKKVTGLIKLQIKGGQANPAPPVGPALGARGVNIMDFCKAYNEQTRESGGQIIPARITIFEDRSFSFVLKTPPASEKRCECFSSCTTPEAAVIHCTSPGPMRPPPPAESRCSTSPW